MLTPHHASGTYNDAEYVEQRRVMMQDWADRLDLLERWQSEGSKQRTAESCGCRLRSSIRSNSSLAEMLPGCWHDSLSTTAFATVLARTSLITQSVTLRGADRVRGASRAIRSNRHRGAPDVLGAQRRKIRTLPGQLACNACLRA